MTRRASLTLLLLFLLLVIAGIQQSLYVPATGGDSLSRGLFAAATLVAMSGMGAQFWLHVLPLCSDTPPPSFLRGMASAGLWCGWLPMALCLVPLGFSLPTEESRPYLHWLFPYTVSGGAAALLLCRACLMTGRGCFHLPAALLCAATALVCGLLWWQGFATCFLATASVLPFALRLLFPGAAMGRPSIWLCFTAVALTLYSLYFHSLILRYPPLSQGAGKGGLFFSALPMAGCLVLLLFPPLRRCRLGQQLAGGLAVLSCILLNGCMTFSSLDGTYLALSGCLAVLTGLLQCHRGADPCSKI